VRLDRTELGVYVISLPRCKERRSEIDRQLGKARIRYEYFDACDKDVLDFQLLVDSHKLGPTKDYNQRSRTHMTRGEIACFLSHASIWRALQASRSAALILEDDAIVPENTMEILAQSSVSIPPDTDVLYLGGFNYPRRLAGIPRFTDRLVKIDSSTPPLWRTHAYVLTARGAESLYRDAFPICAPVDTYMMRRKILTDELLCYAFVPELISQKRTFDNTIEFEHRGRHKAESGIGDHIYVKDGRVVAR
jgi:glycosyl transferase family 25